MTGGRDVPPMGREPPDEGAMPALRRAMEASRAWMAEERALEEAPVERFRVMLRATWQAAGEAMALIAGFGAEVEGWAHDPPWHTAHIACTHEALQSISKALDSVPGVVERKCGRKRTGED